MLKSAFPWSSVWPCTSSFASSWCCRGACATSSRRGWDAILIVAREVSNCTSSRGDVFRCPSRDRFRTAILGGLRIGVALLLRTAILVVGDGVAVPVGGAAVRRGVARLDALAVRARVLGVGDTVGVSRPGAGRPLFFGSTCASPLTLGQASQSSSVTPSRRSRLPDSRFAWDPASERRLDGGAGVRGVGDSVAVAVAVYIGASVRFRVGACQSLDGDAGVLRVEDPSSASVSRAGASFLGDGM